MDQTWEQWISAWSGEVWTIMCLFSQKSRGAYFLHSRRLPIIVGGGTRPVLQTTNGFNWNSSPAWLSVCSHKIIGCTGLVKPSQLGGTFKWERSSHSPNYNPIQLSAILCPRWLKHAIKHLLRIIWWAWFFWTSGHYAFVWGERLNLKYW